MTYSVGPKGQVVIAKEIRDQLGVKPGWIALQRLVGDRVEIYFLPPEHNQSLKGILSHQTEIHIPLGKAWEQARDKAWEREANEEFGS
jgi:bifunctional DNA-binding transcriptional regulator/antitoxin component of YhaV-PrlF toxin-antitoxin module